VYVPSDTHGHAWWQVMSLISVAHFLRFVTFVSTSLPGPADHCKPSYANYKVPDTDIKTILFRKSGPLDLNCGDLIFSGHVFQVRLFVLLLFRMHYSLIQMKSFIFQCIKFIVCLHYERHTHKVCFAL
jgi:hypothetical protein